MCSRTRAATMASYAVALLLRGVPLLRARALDAVVVALPRRFASSLSSSDDTASPLASSSANESDPKGPSQLSTEGTVFSRWKEEEILMDIEPVRTLAKEILHSKRYMDGECLSVEDEKVIEKLLHYHPHSEDKIGCGITAIVVNRHTEFRCSRCFFIVRTDGDLMDFSYKKCLEAYIRDKYPLYAGNFIAKHFKRR